MYMVIQSRIVIAGYIPLMVRSDKCTQNWSQGAMGKDNLGYQWWIILK